MPPFSSVKSSIIHTAFADKQILGMRRRNVAGIGMQHHLLAARAGGVGGKSRQDEIAAEQFVHRGHHVGMLDDLLEDLALVDQVEDALIRALGFEKCDAVLAFQIVQAVEVVADATEEFRGNKIWHDAYAAFFNFSNNLIDIVSHRLTHLVSASLS